MPTQENRLTCAELEAEIKQWRARYREIRRERDVLVARQQRAQKDTPMKLHIELEMESVAATLLSDGGPTTLGVTVEFDVEADYEAEDVDVSNVRITFDVEELLGHTDVSVLREELEAKAAEELFAEPSPDMEGK